MDYTYQVLGHMASILYSAGLAASTKYVPVFVLNTGNTAVNERDKTPSPHGANTLIIYIINKYVNHIIQSKVTSAVEKNKERRNQRIPILNTKSGRPHLKRSYLS